jgi:molybdenum cofactor biosynthesis protein B
MTDRLLPDGGKHPEAGDSSAPHGGDAHESGSHDHAHHDDDQTHEHGHDHDHGDHGHHAHDLRTVGFGVVTVSSSRDLSRDPSGDAIVEAVEASGHAVEARELVGDDYDSVQATLSRLTDDAAIDAVVTTGGTGVSPDDVTVEAAEPLFDKRLPGFGELFRAESRAEIGTKVVGTRATAGIVPGDSSRVPVFCLPGSENAVTLGMEIVLAEVAHLAGLARRD